MSSTVELPLSGEDLASTLGRRLFVSWQDPDTRAIVPWLVCAASWPTVLLTTSSGTFVVSWICRASGRP